LAYFKFQLVTSAVSLRSNANIIG